MSSAALRRRDGQQHSYRAVLFRVVAVALLAEQPCHGRRVFTRLEATFEEFGEPPITRAAAIYEVLDEMSTRGLVEILPSQGRGSDRQRLTRYVATDAGRTMVMDWVELGSGPYSPRTEFLFRLRCAQAVNGLSAVQRLLSIRRQEALKAQTALAPPSRDLPVATAAVVRRLVQRHQDSEVQAELQYLEWAQALLSRATGAQRGETVR